MEARFSFRGTHIGLGAGMALNLLHQVLVITFPLSIAAAQKLIQDKERPMHSVITVHTLLPHKYVIKTINDFIVCLLIPANGQYTRFQC